MRPGIFSHDILRRAYDFDDTLTMPLREFLPRYRSRIVVGRANQPDTQSNVFLVKAASSFNQLVDTFIA